MGRGPRVLKYEYEYADAAARFARACRGDVAHDQCPSAVFRVVCRASFALRLKPRGLTSPTAGFRRELTSPACVTRRLGIVLDESQLPRPVPLHLSPSGRLQDLSRGRLCGKIIKISPSPFSHLPLSSLPLPSRGYNALYVLVG